VPLQLWNSDVSIVAPKDNIVRVNLVSGFYTEARHKGRPLLLGVGKEGMPHCFRGRP
jgi:hypothetical protein